ncbi:hypothetical protein [Staphylococcus massiliensis]|nr:hypothetical protein [Staphylococcus massiliensis]
MPKKPLQIILSNTNNFEKDPSKKSYITVWGKDQEINYNGVAFTINPKAENVKIDKTISQDMYMKDLYATAFGNAEIKKFNDDMKDSKKNYSRLDTKKKEYQRRIKQINKSLGKKNNDFKQDEHTNSQKETSYTTDDYDNMDTETMSNNDLKSVRNSLINEYQSIKQQMKDEKNNQKAIQNSIDQLNDLMDDMDNLTTLSHNYKWLQDK